MDTRQTNEEIHREILMWQRKVVSTNARKGALIELIEDYHGYEKGVRDVLVANRSGSLSGICGVVAELFNVAEEYDTAIESVLGNALQHIVTETEGCARAAISYLKLRNLGRAAFLPLDRICRKPIAESAKQKASKINRYRGLAIDLISFEPKYQEIFYYLLGNVIIADNLSSADNISIKVSQQYRIVTLEGDLINNNGLVEGGSLTPLKDLLGRKRQISDLETDILKSEEKIKALTVRLQDK